jgi:hypothetical protein
MFASPRLQKQQHAQTTALQRVHGGQVKHDSASVFLLRNCFAQPERCLTADNPAFTVNYRDIPNSLDVQTEHNVPSKRCEREG